VGEDYVFLDQPMLGKVCMVTGAASGIGAAEVQSRSVVSGIL